MSGFRERRHRKQRPDTYPVYCDGWRRITAQAQRSTLSRNRCVCGK